MAPSHLLVLSLLLSVGVAALSLIAGRFLETLSGDPVLRDRLWGALLILPLAPPLVVGLILALTPAPVVTLPAPVDAPFVATESAASQTLASAPAAAPLFDLEAAVWSLAAVAAILTILAMARLALRGARLVRLLRAAVPSGPELQTMVDQAAHAIGARPLGVRVSLAAQEPLLVGLVRPHLVLPAGFRGADPAGPAVIAHELAHLKRGDHRAVWFEEALLILLAFNPFTPLIRARRAAAREEACDALALAGAAPETRRAYAQSLIEALRSPSSPNASLPALTFTGTPRSQAMRRLKSILAPPATARQAVQLTVIAAGMTLFVVAGLASAAVAAQRAPDAPPETEVSHPATLDHALVSAALNPVVNVAWPGACGFGSDGPSGQVFIHGEEGCPTLVGPRIVIRTLAGADLSADPRAAFDAVKAACDAGRPVEIAFTQGGRANAKTVTCASAAVAPVAPVQFTATIAYDPAIVIAAGDALEIILERDMEGGGTASTDIVLNLVPSALPGQASAVLRPPLLPRDLQTGTPFTLSAKIVSADGAVKAVSDRDRGRSFAPFVITQSAISTSVRMLPTERVSSVQSRVPVTPSSHRASASEALTVQVRQPERTPLIIGSGDRLRLTLSAENRPEAPRYTIAMEMALSPNQPVARSAVFTLENGQLPSLTEGRVYELRAAIMTPEGDVSYVAAPVTVRMAPGSRARIATMRPELMLSPVSAP